MRGVAHPNQELLERFYNALSRRDWITMTACYHPLGRFKDPIYDLEGSHIGGMWKLLLTRGQDLQVSFRDIRADDSRGSAHWEATYTFSRTGNKVHNVIDSSFVFSEGKILEQIDRFDFWRWSRQALGTSGALWGWTPFLRTRVSRTANEALEKFMGGSRR